MSKFGKMASDFENTLVRIGEKSRFLVERYKVAISQRDRLLEKNSDLQSQLDAARKTIESLHRQIEYLTIAANIAPTRESLDLTRSTISELVREIDRCIADISD